MSSKVDALEEIGLDIEIVAGSVYYVFTKVIGGDPAEDVDMAGWNAVATHADAMFGESTDEDLSLSFSQYAATIRRAYSKAFGEDEIPDFDSLEPRLRHAWIAAARHLVNVFNLESSRDLAREQEKMVDWALQRLPT